MSAMNESFATLQNLRVGHSTSSLPRTPAKDPSQRTLRDSECKTPSLWKNESSFDDLAIKSLRSQEAEDENSEEVQAKGDKRRKLNGVNFQILDQSSIKVNRPGGLITLKEPTASSKLTIGPGTYPKSTKTSQRKFTSVTSKSNFLLTGSTETIAQGPTNLNMADMGKTSTMEVVLTKEDGKGLELAMIDGSRSMDKPAEQEPIHNITID
ncbi:hypothetical protein REPUB_Repub01dG0161000 [Reevesia pubescens]